MTRYIMAALVAATTAVLALGVSGASAAGPINNDCSAGYVSFTFDDGPDLMTPALIAKLQSLNLNATFFVLGNKATANPAMVAAEVAAGFGVQNHTYDHASFTGASTATSPLTDQQVTDELTTASQAIVSAGAPMPTLYRPPYGDINSYYDLMARNLGYRIVMPWGTNIVDSRDWTMISAAQITSNVINGTTDQNGFHPGIKADSIISMHDGDDPVRPQATIDSLQGIVDYMNAHHLCSSAAIRPDATGGVVPPPAPSEPTFGNLVQNPSMEQLRTVGIHTEPVCYQQAGASIASNTAAWSLSSDTHSGAVASQVEVSKWVGGDRKVVLTQRQSEAACLATVTPGKTYSFWVWYKGSWQYNGAAATRVSIATYYKINGNWVYWQGSALYPPTSAYNLAYFTSAPLPANATAVSFGLAIMGPGTLITDDYAMVQN